MFTGLIEDLGTLASLTPLPNGGARVIVETRLPEADLFHGASVAVDGACLTVVALTTSSGVSRFSADASVETLARTTLGERKAGDRVNLERPMALGDRLGGHLVLGHVDGVGTLVSREIQGEGTRFVAKLPQALLPLVVEKGSIALDGISLTVNDLVGDDAIALFLIPETLRATTWGQKQPGERLNVEADILGKHVARLLGARVSPSKVDLALLERSGFLSK